jgi:hypothetical protein
LASPFIERPCCDQQRHIVVNRKLGGSTMLGRVLKTFLFMVILFTICAPPCFAKAKGYCYVVAYSYRQKVVVFTPVFMKKVKDKSYSEEEFVADVELLRKMESSFEDHVRGTMNVDAPDLTVSARAAFKSLEIAKARLDAEKQEYIRKAWEIKEASNFSF